MASLANVGAHEGRDRANRVPVSEVLVRAELCDPSFGPSVDEQEERFKHR